ncbi:MAG: redoxin domain-containing protein [Cyclobacteriaceae bacterium]|nr:redoxin domain-containing protein [Cyclobacteriaceae bacterium]
MMVRCTLFISFIGWCTCAKAQIIENFTLTDVRFDKPVSLRDYSGHPAVVVIFTSNNCAFDEHYRSRIIHMAEKYRQRVPFLLVNSYTEADESVEKMKSLHAEMGFEVPYLADKQQLVMHLLQARKSPECVLLKPANGKFTVVYRGAIDDSPQMEEAIKHAWLSDAIEAVLSGKNIVTKEQRPVGCAID